MNSESQRSACADSECRQSGAPDSGRGVTGVILAGGLGRRMGGIDKGLQPFAGKPMVASVIERLAPQVSTLSINANRNPDAYAAFGLPVWPDRLQGFAGPLAGLLAGLQGADTPLVVTVPCDSPFLPADLVVRLRTALEEACADLAFARADGRDHPVFCLCKRELAESLETYLASGQRKVADWFAGLNVVSVAFDDCPESFVNINTPDELRQLEGRG